MSDCSPPGSSVHGILQARTLEGVATPSSRGSSRPRDPALVSCISRFGRCFLVALALPGKPVLGAGATADQFSSVAQSCPALCDPMNRSMPGLRWTHFLSSKGIQSSKTDTKWAMGFLGNFCIYRLNPTIPGPFLRLAQLCDSSQFLFSLFLPVWPPSWSWPSSTYRWQALASLLVWQTTNSLLGNTSQFS